MVRIRMRDSDDVGETAYVLKVDESDPMHIQAEVRIDRADRIEFMPMVTEATAEEGRKMNLHPDEKRDNTLMDAKAVRENRNALLVIAQQERFRRHQYLSARAIQVRVLAMAQLCCVFPNSHKSSRLFH